MKDIFKENLGKKLEFESSLVRTESLKVLNEFDNLGDDIFENNYKKNQESSPKNSRSLKRKS